jgi:hypothetical protein
MISNSDLERWGDYSGNQRKYDEPGIVWVSSSFGQANKKNNTWISQLVSPELMVAVEETKKARASILTFPNPANQYMSIDFELHEPMWIDATLYDLQGKPVAHLLHGQPRNAGKIRLEMSTEPLSAGVYILRDTAKGEVLATEEVIIAH